MFLVQAQAVGQFFMTQLRKLCPGLLLHIGFEIAPSAVEGCLGRTPVPLALGMRAAAAAYAASLMLLMLALSC